MSTQVSSSDVAGNYHDDDYAAFLLRLDARFNVNCEQGAKPLFTTDVQNLWELYLDSFVDPTERQHHNCHACRQFVERFGSLVTIDASGATTPVMWHEDDAQVATRPAMAALARVVRRAKVTGVFLSSDATWGTPKTGVWRHMAVMPHARLVFRRATQTAGQAQAEKREDFRTVMNALNEFTLTHLETALILLRSDALYRSERVLGQAEWLHNLHVSRANARGDSKANVVWLAIATAPAGFCHPRSSVIGTLLEDIAAGKDFDSVSRAFAAKMHPLQYQRPQAAPTSGAIAAAEKVMQQLGAAGSLARRFARVDELQALWRPAPKKEEAATGGVFGHLQPKGSQTPVMAVPPQTMTWDKFQRTVLPTADRIEFQAPLSGNYTALVTAVNADSPPILQWDSEQSRNPVSWYVWVSGASASSFGLRSGLFYAVSAVTLKPSMWGGGCAHQGDGVIFVIADARESKQTGAALFPQILKAEFHGIRSVLEAYSGRASIEGMDQPHAAGMLLDKGAKSWKARVRVWSGGRSLDFELDRWD